MADDENEQKGIIPKEFPLWELHQEAQQILTAKRDFVQTRLNSGKPVAPSKDLALYSIARLEALVKYLAQRVREEREGQKEAPAPKPERRVVEDDF